MTGALQVSQMGYVGVGESGGLLLLEEEETMERYWVEIEGGLVVEVDAVVEVGVAETKDMGRRDRPVL